MGPSQQQQEHDLLRRSIVAFNDAVAAPKPYGAAIMEERLRFSHLFHDHVVQEQRRLRNYICLSSCPETLRLIAGHEASMSDLRRTYASHMQQWHMDAMNGDVEGYRNAVDVLQRDFLALMLWEDDHLPI